MVVVSSGRVDGGYFLASGGVQIRPTDERALMHLVDWCA
jgi:hypothetical protein